MPTNPHEFLPESKTQAFDSLLRQSSEGCVLSDFFDYPLQVWVGSPAGVSATDGSDDAGVASAAADRTDGSDAGSAEALATCFLFFLIKLRTVSDACAPLLIQYSARSSFSVLL